MKEYKILIPVVDGITVRHILREATRTFGGHSLGPAVDGEWIDPEGYLHKDKMGPLYIATENEPELLAFVDYIKNLTKQEAMYLRYPNGRVDIR